MKAFSFRPRLRKLCKARKSSLNYTFSVISWMAFAYIANLRNRAAQSCQANSGKSAFDVVLPDRANHGTLFGVTPCN
jgi:hypothetical protein